MDYLDKAASQACANGGCCCSTRVQVGAGPVPADLYNACGQWGMIAGMQDGYRGRPYDDNIINRPGSILSDVRVSASAALFIGDCAFSVQESYRKGYAIGQQRKARGM